MRLLVDPLIDEDLDQTFSLSLIRRNVIEIKPYIYMHNAPIGTFTIRIIKDENVIDELDFTSSDIKNKLDTTDNYAHVYLPLSTSLKLDSGDYIARLTSSDYTYNDSAYIGWVKEWDSLFYEYDEAINAPRGLRILTYDKNN